MHDARRVKKLYESGTISRREFMQGAAAVGLSASAALSFATRVEAATPRRGGDAVAASAGGATSDSLDVATWVNQHQMMTGMATNEYLTETDASETLKPRLARSWEAADRGATWVFKLEKGVEHSNGKTVDADDVIASLRYHVGEDSKSSFKPQVAQIAADFKPLARTPTCCCQRWQMVHMSSSSQSKMLQVGGVVSHAISWW